MQEMCKNMMGGERKTYKKCQKTCKKCMQNQYISKVLKNLAHTASVHLINKLIDTKAFNAEML